VINDDAVFRNPQPVEKELVDIASVSPGSVDQYQQIAWGSAPSRARRKVKDGDVIFSTVRPGGRSYCLMIEPSDSTVVSTGFAVMSPKGAMGSSYLASVARSHEFADYLASVAHGSAYPAVSIKAMGRYMVNFPLT